MALDSYHKTLHLQSSELRKLDSAILNLSVSQSETCKFASLKETWTKVRENRTLLSEKGS